MKFLKNIYAFFANNWWLKILALLLAIAAYYGDQVERSRNQDNAPNDRSLFQLP